MPDSLEDILKLIITIETVKNIANSFNPYFENYKSHELEYSLDDNIFKIYPEDRLTIQDCLNHVWFYDK